MFALPNIQRIWTIVQFELIRLFGSKRGLITLAAFSCIWFLIYFYVINSAADFITSASFKNISQQVFGQLNLLNVLEWGVPQLAVYWLVAMYLLPMFALMFACDQTCSDRERGTLRFILLRTTRSELLLGRFLGQVLISFILITLTLSVSLILALVSGQTLTLDQMSIALKVLGQLILITLPFIGSMSLINSFVKTAKMSMVIYTLLYVLGGILINLIGYFAFDVSVLFYLYPGEQIDRVLGFEASLFDQYLLPSIQTILYLVFANIALKRASL